MSNVSRHGENEERLQVLQQSAIPWLKDFFTKAVKSAPYVPHDYHGSIAE
jgi:hypothetical protein